MMQQPQNFPNDTDETPIFEMKIEGEKSYKKLYHMKQMKIFQYTPLTDKSFRERVVYDLKDLDEPFI